MRYIQYKRINELFERLENRFCFFEAVFLWEHYSMSLFRKVKPLKRRGL